MKPAVARMVWAGLATVFLFASSAGVFAGIDVNMERELARIVALRDAAADRNRQELVDELNFLSEQLEQGVSDPFISERIMQIEDELIGATRQIQDREESIQNLGERPDLFSRAKNRIGVFTFDDPDGTGLGNAISFLLSKAMLFSAPVSSFAIVNYQTSLAEQSEDGLAYFDKVDLLTADQNFLLSVWGRILDAGDAIVIETFGQVPAQSDAYISSVVLPEAMGKGSLRARLKPDRFMIQSLRLAKDEALRAIAKGAEEVGKLRGSPSRSAPVLFDLEQDSPYYISDSRQGWVELTLQNGASGWTSVDALCEAACRQLVGAAEFANRIVALAADGAPPTASGELTRTARSVSDNLQALQMLSDNPAEAREIANNWLNSEEQGGPPIPGGASFANLLAVATIEAELQSAREEEPFDSVKLDPEFVRAVAADLAQASVADPSDVTVLENLAVLFDYLRDYSKRDLALEIARSLRN